MHPWHEINTQWRVRESPHISMSEYNDRILIEFGAAGIWTGRCQEQLIVGHIVQI
jgi:hypothetical protein